MATINTSVTTEKRGEDNAIEVVFELPDTVQGCVDAYGEDIVFHFFSRSATLQLQANLRARMKKAEEEKKPFTQANADEYVAKWKPSMRAPAKSQKEKAAELLAGLSPDERAKLLSSLKK